MSAVVNPAMKFPTLDEVRKQRARISLAAFTTRTCSYYRMGWFHAAVAKRLDKFYDDVAAKRSPRLMIFAPPRHGKTELVSRRFPAYAFGRNPDLQIIAASYAADLASRNNRDVQRIMDANAYGVLFPATRLYGKNIRTVSQSSWLRNSDIFEIVDNKGSYRSAGVGVGITGMGADMLLIDDPIKDAAQAYSQTIRDSLWEWYLTTARTRVETGGGVLVVLTRWHEDDLAGRLLLAAKEDPQADQWEVVSYPAIAEVEEPLRKVGDPLDAERWPLTQLYPLRATLGPTNWNSLFQQRPSAAEGNVFKRGFAKFIPRALVKPQRTILSWDTSFGKNNTTSDFSVSLGMQLFERGVFVFDRKRERYNYASLKEATYLQASQVTENFGLEALLIEDKASGQSLVQDAQADTRLPVKAIEPDADKVVRANVCVPYWESGRVFFPMDPTTGLPEPWVNDFLELLYAFPNGRWKDDIDAFTQGLRYLVMGGGGANFVEWMYQQVAKNGAAEKALKEEDAVHHPIEYVRLFS